MSQDVNMRMKAMRQKGCLFTGVFVVSIIWIVGATIAAQLMMWVMEQSIFEASFLFPDLRWLIIAAYISIVGLPILMVRFILNNEVTNVIFQFWATINFLGLFLIPGRLFEIHDAFFVSLVQLIGLLIYLIIYTFFLKRRNIFIRWKEKSNTLVITVLMSGLVSIPWVLWGAIGSPLDLVLNLIISLLSGYFLTITISQLIAGLFPEGKRIEPAGKLFFGLIVLVGLLIFSTVLGQNGQQWMLVFTLPLSAWILAGLLSDEINKTKTFLSYWFLLAVLISLPLIWFDPDELSLLIGSEKGEILSWVNQAISYSVVILILCTAITGFLRKKLESLKLGITMMGIAVFSWIVVLTIYFTLGQPGFFGESIFVIMKDQPDLSGVNSIDNISDKKVYIYETSTAISLQSQKELVDILKKFRLDYEPYYLVNAIEVKAGPIWKLIIQSRKDVDRVLDNPNLRPLPEEIPTNIGDQVSVDGDLWNLKMIEVDKVWEEFGVKGAGIVIGQADSGVDGNHPALREQYIGSKETGDFTWFDPWFHTSFPSDISGHGTHTLGTILGKNVGVAPEAKWIGCVNLGRNLGNPGDYLACMQFLFAPFPENGNPMKDGRPDRGADILNNSWGCPEMEGCDPNVFNQAVNALRLAGIFVVSSAGNNGYYGCESITDPIAIYDSVFTVGAIDILGEIAPFSSMGPVTVDQSGRIKPDLVAPGVDILSTMPNASYSELSGTSMAGPHVAGTIALMWSANPNLRGQVELTEEILTKTASPYVGSIPACANSNALPNVAIGYGVLNAYNAVEEALKIR